MQRDQRGDRGVQQPLRGFAAVGIQHRVGVHVVADIAHQHQAAARQGQRAAARLLVAAVGVQAARHHEAALLERILQRADHQAEPVAIGQHLVLGIDRGDRILQVLDGGDRGFQQHVGDARRIVAADRAAAVDLDLDVQSVVPQQHRGQAGAVAAVADERRRIAQAGLAAIAEGDGKRRAIPGRAIQDIARRIGMAAGSQRRDLVQHCPGACDHPVAAHRIVAAAARRAAVFRNRVGAIQRVVQAAPARVGGIQRIARVGHRHYELRPGDAGDLGIDAAGVDRDLARLRLQIADLVQEREIGRLVDRQGAGLAARMGTMPTIDLLLQGVAAVQQRMVARRQLAHQHAEALPEGTWLDARAGDRLGVDEVVQRARDAEAAGFDVEVRRRDVIHLGFLRFRPVRRARNGSAPCCSAA